MKIKFGLKLWSSDTELIDEAVKLIEKGFFDYIELILKPHFLNVDPFAKYDVPYVVHVPNENFGVDIGDANKRRFSIEMIDNSLRFADILAANYVVLHSGSGSTKNALSILSKIKDKRILFENMPLLGIHGEKCLGYDANSMSNLINNRGLCLDFGHAVKASISLKEDYRKIISDFLKLKPKIFHISDGDLTTEVDNHLGINEGQFDLRYFKDCINKSQSKLVTLETPRLNRFSLEEDLRDIELLKTF